MGGDERHQEARRGRRGTRSGAPALTHRPALDGVRAIAILLVLGAHSASVPKDGWLGVDLFFVLSGFLITSLLLAEHASTGRVRLTAFWARRGWRLIPAVLVVLATYVVALAATGRLSWFSVGGALAGLTYSSNLLIAGGYALPTGTHHLWSLAQEEQFYLLWPPLLFLVLRGRARIALAAVAALLAVEIAAGVTLPRTDRLWFAPDTRGIGILVGCAAGLLWQRRRSQVEAVARYTWPIALVLFVGFVFAPLGSLMFRGPLVLFCVACAVLIVRCTHETAGLSRALRPKPVVWLGLISYSVYIWHLPVFLALGIDQIEGPFWLDIGAITLTLLLAAATYQLVERPLRKYGRARSQRGPIRREGGQVEPLGALPAGRELV